MKKEIWDWLHPKLRGNSGNSSIKNSLKAGRHACSSAVPRGVSSFSPCGCWSNSGRMSGVEVDETEAVSGGMETLSIGVLGQLGRLDRINEAEEGLPDRPNFDIQEEHVDKNNPHDLRYQIIQSQQPSDHGRIKEIYCRFSFLTDYLISRRNNRGNVFNAFDGRKKIIESELEAMSGQRSSVGRKYKRFGWKMIGPASFHFEQPKLEYKKVKRAFLKKIHHKFETKKSDHTPSKEFASEILESTSEQKCSNYAHSSSSSSAERHGDQMVCAPTNKEQVDSQLGAADYRIKTDSDYVVLEW